VGESFYQWDDFGHVNLHKLFCSFVSIKVFLSSPPFDKNESLGVCLRLVDFEPFAPFLGERHFGLDGEQAADFFYVFRAFRPQDNVVMNHSVSLSACLLLVLVERYLLCVFLSPERRPPALQVSLPQKTRPSLNDLSCGKPIEWQSQAARVCVEICRKH